MKKSLWAAALLLLSAGVFGANPPSKAKVHGLSVTGTVVSVEEAARKMVVKSAAGKQVSLVWTGATKTAGGPIQAGAKVTIRYLQKDGKNIATSIHVGGEKPAVTSGSAAPATATPAAAATSPPKSL